MIEGDFVDPRQDFESARRFVLEKYHDRRFDRRTAGLYAGNFFDHDRCVGREGQDRLHPVADLIEGKIGNVLLAAERVDFLRRGGAVAGRDAVEKTLSYSLLVQVAADEHEAIEAFLFVGPRAAWTTFEEHVHALKDKLIGVFAQV